jgi:N-acyl homoserine lactone hydrolase
MSRSGRATRVRRLFVILCGFEILPKSISVRGADPRFILSEPVCVYLLDTEDGWVLLDAGLNPDNGRSAVRVRERFGRLGLVPPVIRDAHLLEPQLRAIGVTAADIKHVVLSHLHYDHGGCLAQFRHAIVWIQRREFEHAFGPDPGFPYFRDEYAIPGLQWQLCDGDWELMPGLRFIDTRGHTEGHQSALIGLPETGTVILPFDAGDLQENFDREVLPGESCDDAAALASLLRIKTLAAQLRATVLFFHDPVALQAMRLSPDCYC